MGFSEAFKKKFEIWKNYLLDMSRRNRQLYFKPSARNSLEIIYPDFNNLFDSIIIHNRKHIFIPVYKPEEGMRMK